MPKPAESVEFKLLIELTHPTPIIQTSDIFSAFQNRSFDYMLFLKMLKWHRVTPQAYQRLAPIQDDLPADFAQKLNNMNMRCRMQSLRQSAWLAKFSRHLKEKKIAFISLKGIALSQHLYGDSSYRQVRDIDLMVAPEHVDSAEKTLFELGFIRTLPHAEATPKMIRVFNKHKKDREYRHPDDGTLLELHWRLTEVKHPFNPSLTDLLTTSTSVQIHNEEIPTVSGEFLWLYQCLHGSYSGWYRLRWVCDIALLLTSHQSDWDTLLRLAERHSCLNSLTEGVGLASALYHIDMPEAVCAYINQNGKVQQHIEQSTGYLYRMQIVRGMTDIMRIPFWAPASSFIKYILTIGPINSSDFKRIHLPDHLFFAYYLLRPFSFLIRHIISKKGNHPNE